MSVEVTAEPAGVPLATDPTARPMEEPGEEVELILEPKQEVIAAQDPR
ncbi:MAG TPA: hypothetical protein VFL97_09980 [Nitrococcus sp.]|nr:hypothetical protein [Nitrococcus sp.]